MTIKQFCEKSGYSLDDMENIISVRIDDEHIGFIKKLPHHDEYAIITYSNHFAYRFPNKVFMNLKIDQKHTIESILKHRIPSHILKKVLKSSQ